MKLKLNITLIKLIPWAYMLLALLTARLYLSTELFIPGVTPQLIAFIFIFFVVALYPGLKCLKVLKKDRSFLFFNIFLVYTFLLIVYSFVFNYLTANSIEKFNLVKYFMAGMSALCVYFLALPKYFTKACRLLYQALPFMALLMLPLAKEGLVGDLSGFILMPALIPIVFWKDLPLKKKIVYAVLAILIIITSFQGDARSNMIKFAVAFFMGLLVIRFYSLLLIYKHLVWLIMVVPFVFLWLGLTGQFNIFAETEKQQSYYEEELNEQTLIDTRTSLYTDALTSAVVNEYILFGRGYGRGYQSQMALSRYQKAHRGEELGYYSSERNAETGMINFFTWGGIIYVLIYTAMICSIVFYGMYRSSNRYVLALSVFLSFYFVYDWVENFQGMYFHYFCYWFMIAICLSPYFRSMKDFEFRKFIRSTF